MTLQATVDRLIKDHLLNQDPPPALALVRQSTDNSVLVEFIPNGQPSAPTPIDLTAPLGGPSKSRAPKAEPYVPRWKSPALVPMELILEGIKYVVAGGTARVFTRLHGMPEDMLSPSNLLGDRRYAQLIEMAGPEARDELIWQKFDYCYQFYPSKFESSRVKNDVPDWVINRMRSMGRQV